MSYAMDWSQDFCLSCDNANHTEGPYCSEACRLSDLDRSAESESSPALHSSSSPSSRTWSVASSPSRSWGMYLPPAVNFSALRSSPAGSTSNSHVASSTSYLYHDAASHASTASPYAHRTSQPRRTLTTSSSRSSLSSVTTNGSSSHGLSDQAIDQLRSYFQSFDQSRDMRRRRTLN